MRQCKKVFNESDFNFQMGTLMYLSALGLICCIVVYKGILPHFISHTIELLYSSVLPTWFKQHRETDQRAVFPFSSHFQYMNTHVILICE